MRRVLTGCLGIVLAALLAGCQCCGLTERYADHIDDIADWEPDVSCIYTPCLDLTRIGKPDWCACGLNRWWCVRGCCDTPIEYTTVWCPFCAEDYPAYNPASMNRTSGGRQSSPPVPPSPEMSPGKSPYSASAKSPDEGPQGERVTR